MGHCEMLLAVAGLGKDEITKRTKKLAGDWSDLAAHERQAFAFAEKLTREPSAVGAADVAALVKTFGPERAADLIWHVAWCNYMTRVADAFQLPLEKENVFARPAKKDDPGK
jgi:alkylhydroperoxidase family enzyme